MVRSAGVDVVGMYAVSVAIVSISVGLFAAALDTNLLRRREKSSGASVIVAKLLIWVCVSPIALLVLDLLEVPLLGGIVVYAAMFFLHVAETIGVQARLANRDVWSVIPRLIPQMAFLIALLLMKPRTFEEVAILFLLSWGLVVIFATTSVGIMDLVRFKEIPSLLVAAKTIAGMLIFTQIYGNIDLVVLTAFLNNRVAGEYKIAQAFASILLPTISALIFVYLSELSVAIEKNNGVQVRRMLGRQIRLHIGVGIFVVLASSIIFPVAIPYLYGEGTLSSVGPAVILTGSASLNSVAMVLVYTLLGLKRDRAVLGATGAGAAASCGLNLVLVPIFGTMGAAWASVLTFLVMIVVLGVMTHKAVVVFSRACRSQRQCRSREIAGVEGELLV